MNFVEIDAGGGPETGIQLGVALWPNDKDDKTGLVSRLDIKQLNRKEKV